MRSDAESYDPTEEKKKLEFFHHFWFDKDQESAAIGHQDQDKERKDGADDQIRRDGRSGSTHDRNEELSTDRHQLHRMNNGYDHGKRQNDHVSIPRSQFASDDVSHRWQRHPHDPNIGRSKAVKR